MYKIQLFIIDSNYDLFTLIKLKTNLYENTLTMNKEKTAKQKTILNVGYCETTTEWLNRIITELADEKRNFVDLSIICA